MAKVIKDPDPPIVLTDAPDPALADPGASPLVSGDEIARGAPIVQLTFDQLNQLLERAARASQNSQGAGGGEELRLAAGALQALGDEVRRTVRRSNASHPGISDFSYPEGEEARPKARLTHETFFCGAPQREDQLTPTEIDLYNKFDRDMEARDGRWTAAFERNGSRRRLSIMVPAKTNDDLTNLPPLTQILSELLYGSEVADPTKSMARLIAAETKIAELLARIEAMSATQAAPLAPA